MPTAKDRFKFTLLKILILPLAIILFTAGFIFSQNLFSPQKLSNFTPMEENNFSTASTNAMEKPPATPSAAILPKPPSVPSVYIPQTSGKQFRIPILTYHYIGDNPNPQDLQRNALSVGPTKFAEQMKYLSNNGYTTMTLDSLYPIIFGQGSLPPKPVIITVDDGYMDFYYNAYPIIRQYGIHATVFIPTGLMNQAYYLTWAQIREMGASGYITYGAHTVHHLSLPSVSQSTLEYELTESKKVLQEQLGVPINFMAYPYGTANGIVIEAVKRAEYMGAVGTWAGKMQSKSTIYDMPRIKISGSLDLAAFISLL